jgi:ferrous-iron efflux pump FieF
VKTLTGEAAARRNLAVARLSVTTAAVLGVLKLGAAVFTGSLSIIASLVDSVMDLVASLANLFAVRLAGRPADEGHAYGHGKAEGLAGLVQGVVVAFSGVFLLVEGVRRLVEGWQLQHTDLGIAVMVVSTAASAWISHLLKSTAKRTGSVALGADYVHYASDVWTNLGVLGALVVMRLTGWTWPDGVVAAAVAAIVLGTAIHVLRRSVQELMDAQLPESEVQALLAEVQAEVPHVRGFHDVRTRRAGPTIFVDVHVQLDRDLSFAEAHRLSEQVVRALEAARPGAHVNVHADPHPLLPSDLG